MTSARILLIGGSGLVGRSVSQQAAMPLHLLSRRTLDLAAARNSDHHQIVADPADWGAHIAHIAPDILICTLGTTLRTAGSKAAFRAVDHDLVLSCATAAKSAGARRCITISSVGASMSGNFYLRTKAEMEAGLSALNFDRVDVLRPGLLTGGNRTDVRPGERIASFISPVTDLLMLGPLARYASTPADRVARAILTLAGDKDTAKGTHAHENAAIRRLAGSHTG